MDPSLPEIDIDNLKAIKLLGKGATGTVILVQHKEDSSRPFALKIIPKFQSQTARALSELSILARLSHPSLPTLLGSFQTSHIVAYATPFCSGGDLHSLRFKYPDHSFSPSIIRFYLAEIVCALQHLHDMGIVYRDLKPENVLVQENGHVILTDFDLSRDCLPDPPVADTCHVVSTGRKRIWSRSRVSPVTRRRSSSSSSGEGQRCNSFVGTEEYVSPEMVSGLPHGFSVDWWALGILAYEMLYGTTPFKGRNKKETFFNILMKPPTLIGRSTPLTDLISQLLEKEQSKRLGYGINGASDIKQHEFFRGVQWDLLTEVSRPPFIPPSLEEEELLENGVDTREYFAELGLEVSTPPSSLRGPLQQDYQQNILLTEF